MPDDSSAFFEVLQVTRTDDLAETGRWQTALGRSNRCGWLLVRSGCVMIEGTRGRMLRRGGLLRVGEDSRPQQFHGEAEVTLLEFGGEFARRYAQFFAERYGGPFAVHARSRLFGVTDRLERLLTDRLRTLAERSRAAFEWFACAHEELERQRVWWTEILQTRADDPRLAHFAVYSLPEIAAKIGYSADRLSRRLRTLWGANPRDVLIRARMEEAGRQLLASTIPVAPLGHGLGYASPAAFATSFRRFHGVSPSEFRQAGVARGLPATEPVLRVGARRNLIAHLVDPFYGSNAPRRDDRPSAHDWEGPYFRIICAGKAAHVHRRRFDLSVNSFVEQQYCFILALAGATYFETGDKRLLLDRGTLVAFPQPLNATLYTAPDQTHWLNFYLNLEGPHAGAFFRHVTNRFGCQLRLRTHSPLFELADRITGAVGRAQRPALFWSRLAHEWLQAWLAECEAVASEGRATTHRLTPGNVLGSTSIRSMKALAQKVGYSRWHLGRRLRQQWALPPAANLRAIRLEHAARMLRTTDRSVAKIAVEAGYDSTSGFIVAFKRAFEQTPLRYRHRRT